MGKTFGMIMTYNSADTLENLYRKIPLDSLDQVFVVDDGSGDGTARVADALGIPFVGHIHRGYGGNVKEGFRYAFSRGAHYVVEIHGDGQYAPQVIPTALDRMRNYKLDLLLGSRFADRATHARDTIPFIRFVGNKILSSLARRVLGTPLSEFHNGFRIYSRNVGEIWDLEKLSENYLFSFQIIALAQFANMPIDEISVRCDYSGPHSSMSLLFGCRYAVQVVYVLILYILAKNGIVYSIFRSCLRDRNQEEIRR